MADKNAEIIRKQTIGWGIAALAVVMLGSMLGFWGYYHLVLAIELKNQRVLAHLPPQLNARVETTSALPVQVYGPVAVQVPVDQVITVPLQGNFPVQIKIDMPVPLHFSVPFKGQVPINSSVDIETTTAAILPHLPDMPLKIRLPIQINVPINTIIPVHTSFRFYYDGPLDLQFNQQVSTHIQTTLKSTVSMHHNMLTPPLGGFDVRLYPQQTPAAVTMHSHIRQPLTHLKLSRYAPVLTTSMPEDIRQ